MALSVRFRQGKAEIFIKKQLIGKGKRRDNLYWLEMKGSNAVANVKKVNDMTNLWHKRFGQLNVNSLLKLQKSNVVEGLNDKIIDELKFCDACAQGKPAVEPFTDTRPRSTKPLK